VLTFWICVTSIECFRLAGASTGPSMYGLHTSANPLLIHTKPNAVYG
jgi:hypothetical protein